MNEIFEKHVRADQRTEGSKQRGVVWLAWWAKDVWRSAKALPDLADTDSGTLIIAIWCLPLSLIHAALWVLTCPITTTYWMMREPKLAAWIYGRKKEKPDNRQEKPQ